MHYGELNPAVRRIGPEEVVVKKRLDVGALSFIYAASFGGNNVILKLETDVDSMVTHEANALYLLQGVPCVPEMYGFLVGVPRIQPAELPRYPPAGAIVEEHASGRPILKVDNYTNPYLLKNYHAQTGVNLHGEVALRIANHFRSSLERNLVDRDFRHRDIFLDTKPDGSVKVTKVDQGYIRHREDDIEPHKYDDVMRCLIGLFPDLSYVTPDRGWFSSGQDDRLNGALNRTAREFRSKG